MFVSKKTLEHHVAFMTVDIKRLDERYWALWHKHEALLNHLGLTEHTIPAKSVLRAKDGPEPGP